MLLKLTIIERVREINKVPINEPCWCGSGKKYLDCHLTSDMKAFEKRKTRGIIIKTEEEITGIKRSGQLTTEILDILTKRIKPGVKTNEINEWVHEYTIAHGATPAPLNYNGFPKSVCTSINQVICHGIPDETVLKDGDIINVDVTCILDGYYADASRMYMVGEPSNENKKLVRIAKECLEKGLEQVKPDNTIGDIGFAIQKHAEGNGYSVVRDLGGHGIGLDFHEEPFVPHFGRPRTGPVLKPGMTFTIEPMINAGSFKCKLLDDGWTVVTADGSLSAQWEHTVLVTETGVEVLAK